MWLCGVAFLVGSSSEATDRSLLAVYDSLMRKCNQPKNAPALQEESSFGTTHQMLCWFLSASHQGGAQILG